MRTKAFDCVRMKREAARRILRKLAGMTPKQQLAFWEEQATELRERQRAARDKLKGLPTYEDRSGPDQSDRRRRDRQR